jgi:peptidoglycan hydrolase CwlO-like protein
MATIKWLKKRLAEAEQEAEEVRERIARLKGRIREKMATIKWLKQRLAEAKQEAKEVRERIAGLKGRIREKEA